MLEGSADPPPRRLQNYIFRTTPKAENGQSTVKCRDYFIFQAPKCTRATFSRSLAPDPMHRASLQHSPRPAIAGGDGACSPEAYVVPGLSLSVLRLALFGLVSHSRTWPRPANHWLRWRLWKILGARISSQYLCPWQAGCWVTQGVSK